eukprot:15457255-Alexandrium_andersonii.AAC.1
MLDAVASASATDPDPAFLMDTSIHAASQVRESFVAFGRRQTRWALRDSDALRPEPPDPSTHAVLQLLVGAGALPGDSVCQGLPGATLAAEHRAA